MSLFLRTAKYDYDVAAKEIFGSARLPALCFTHASVMAVIEAGLTSAVVVSAGHELTSVAAVWKFKLVQHLSKVFYCAVQISTLVLFCFVFELELLKIYGTECNEQKECFLCVHMFRQ